jgi:hypothetical protein
MDLTGQRFGKLVVLRRDFDQPNRRTYWVCLCDCGATATKMGKYLRNGDTRSCGCVQVATRAAGNPKAGHGGATGGKLSRAYAAWRGMNERCYNPKKRNYKWYGGQGVTVCERWRTSYPNFLADMGDCPDDLTLDRIDPRSNYEPGNCRWASWATQRMNKRRHHAATSSLRS